jgi:hypothetical protein
MGRARDPHRQKMRLLRAFVHCSFDLLEAPGNFAMVVVMISPPLWRMKYAT